MRRENGTVWANLNISYLYLPITLTSLGLSQSVPVKTNHMDVDLLTSLAGFTWAHCDLSFHISLLNMFINDPQIVSSGSTNYTIKQYKVTFQVTMSHIGVKPMICCFDWETVSGLWRWGVSGIWRCISACQPGLQNSGTITATSTYRDSLEQTLAPHTQLTLQYTVALPRGSPERDCVWRNVSPGLFVLGCSLDTQSLSLVTGSLQSQREAIYKINNVWHTQTDLP